MLQSISAQMLAPLGTCKRGVPDSITGLCVVLDCGSSLLVVGGADNLSVNVRCIGYPETCPHMAANIFSEHSMCFLNKAQTSHQCDPNISFIV